MRDTSGGEPSRGREVTPRVPAWLQPSVSSMLQRWPGRIGIHGAAGCVRIELFDRSMTIAAQFFTSVIPILIVIASVADGSGDLADQLGIPKQTQSVLDDVLRDDSNSASFGIVGALIVLGSATSLSRALTRAFAAIWGLPRPTVKITSAWRWVAAVLGIALALIAARALTRSLEQLPPSTLWLTLGFFVADVAIAVFVPWLLLAGRISPRHLLSGAVLFGTVMLVARPASRVWLPYALEVSADRYGSLGVAFTYLAWLYAVSFCFLAAGVLGQVVTTDESPVGRLIRGSREVSQAG